MQRPGKVVVVSQHYPPDQSTTAAIMAAIATHLAQNAEVVVLSGWPGSASASPVDRPQVVEIRNWMPEKAALLKRAAAEVLFKDVRSYRIRLSPIPSDLRSRQVDPPAGSREPSSPP